MNIKANEFSTLVNETFESSNLCDEKLSQEVLILIGTVNDKKIVCSKPFFTIRLEDILLNSTYVPMQDAEAVIFNKALCRSFSDKSGIPLMYIGCYFNDNFCKIFFSKNEKKLLEAIDFASSYGLAG